MFFSLQFMRDKAEKEKRNHQLALDILNAPLETIVKITTGTMGGKSNKFDFSNRANSGAKLGEIIGRDLQKEAEKVKKDAQKQADREAAKARKASIGSSNSSVIEQAPTTTTHIIDLKAPNKDLGDDGVCAMAEGMEAALKSGTWAASLALEDLNLAGNGITTLSLARLAPVVRLAKYDLKTLNLAGNNIRVENNVQAQQWEEFLLAFGDCMKLRRLDLSDNIQLGSRALEVFARVHTRERAVDPSPPGGDKSVLSLVTEHSDEQDSDLGFVDLKADEDKFQAATSMADGTFINRRCGIRSIPYITLHNIGLNDSGALWLSYVLEDHYCPSQLISDLNATTAESVIKTYQQNTHSRGVDWTENKTLAKEGMQLLEKTENIREHRLHDNHADFLDVDDLDSAENSGAPTYRGSINKSSLRAKAGNRRLSGFRSIDTDDGGEHETSELESARKKIMRHIVATKSLRRADIWDSGIAVFWASRLILYVSAGPSVRRCYIGEPLFETKAPAASAPRPSTPLASPEKESTPDVNVDKAVDENRRPKASYASKLQAISSSSRPELAITEVTNTPSTPLCLQKPTHRKGAFSHDKAVETISNNFKALFARDDSALRFVKYQQRRIDRFAAEGRVFRDTTTSTHLPLDVAEYMVRFVVSGRDLEICGIEQRRKAVQRGQDKGTLREEMEWLKKDRSAQVVMLLASIGCLSY